MRTKGLIAALAVSVCVAAVGVVAYVLRDQPRAAVSVPRVADEPLSPQVQPDSPALRRQAPQTADRRLIRVQDAPDFPATRLRRRSVEGEFLDPIYTENRVTFRRVRAVPVGAGMQIFGDIFTDFEDDTPRTGVLRPMGQLRVQVTIELCCLHYAYDANGPEWEPAITTRSARAPVHGQSCTVIVRTFEDGFGSQRFELPLMEKPLAPGIYELSAAVHFRSQKQQDQEALKWCSDWYGEHFAGSDGNDKPVFEPVMETPDLHNAYYQQLLDEVGKVRSTAVLYVGDLLDTGDEPNLLAWTPWLQTCDALHRYADEIDRVNEAIIEEARGRLEAQDAPDRIRERWVQDTDAERRRILDVNNRLLKRLGGRIGEAHAQALRKAESVKGAILREVHRFHSSLAMDYWTFIDGGIPYGMHTINAPAFNVWEAVSSGQFALARANGVSPEKRQQRLEAWSVVPASIRDIAFDYLRVKEETNEFDAENFCRREVNTIIYDAETWRRYRYSFLENWLSPDSGVLSSLDTTKKYHNQVWPEAFVRAAAIRDEAAKLGYAWEHYTRTVGMKEEDSAVRADWRNEARENRSLKLGRFHTGDDVSPGAVHALVQHRLKPLRDLLRVDKLREAFKRSVARSD